MPAEESRTADSAQQSSEDTTRPKRRWVDPERENKQNEEGRRSPPKRQRVSRACDQCRSKKDKCDGGQPVCSTCVSLRRSCTYRTNPKKRGLPTGYIRTLELLWGLAFSEVQGSEEVARVLLKKRNIPSHLAAMGKEGEGADTPYATWKNSGVLKDIEKMLSVLDQQEDESGTANPVDGSSVSAIGEDSLPPEALVWQVPDRVGPLDGNIASLEREQTLVPDARSLECGTQTDLPEPPQDQRSTHGTSHARSQYAADFAISDSSAPSALRLPLNAWQLFDIYFSYTHCWLPIIEKHDVLRTAFSYNESAVQVSRFSPGSGDHAAMWAIMTLASVQNEYSASLERIPETRDDHIQPELLYSIARSLIPQESECYELGHIQALLVLSLVKLGQQKWCAAWLLIGQAVRISLYIGLDHPLGSGPRGVVDGKSNSRRKHVFLGCFALETLIASRTGSLPQLSKEEAVRIGPIDEDGLEEWHPWEDLSTLRPERASRNFSRREPLHALSTFNRLISVLSILNDLCHCKHRKSTTQEQLDLIIHDLQRWLPELPTKYHVGSQAKPSHQPPPHLLCLHMAYESTATALYVQTFQKGRSSLEEGFRMRLVDSAKRVSQLLEVYIATYSISATAPIFETYLELAGWKLWGQDADPLIFTMSPDLQPVYRSIAAQIGLVWAVESRVALEAASIADNTRPSNNDFSRLPSSRTADETSLLPQRQIPSHYLRNAARRTDVIENTQAIDAALNTTIPPSWVRAVSDLDIGILPTPSPSLSTAGGAFEPSTQIHGSSISMANQQTDRNAARITSNSRTPMIPNLPPVLQPIGTAYQQTRDDPNVPLDPLVDIDGYGPPRKPRIAPDLDTLFDELASLDGGDKTENQPEFMQNLGFAPNSGVSELYSYYNQLDPLLLSQR